ncbi:2'-5'-oligoadenylate synthase 1-like [Mya arenaria]|uniref:2'-5'-oligoadenylate synthase 1-like n=1 Tax=Mya arenaria TaxID=6604 RepID=UPI0022E381E5|nr:2'-5'-oligoadenylate synthase 1-like [Mya arenaria]
MDVYSVGSERELNGFIDRYVRPDTVFQTSCNTIVDRLVHFLQNNVSGRLRPRRVVKSGSLGKGTAVRGKSDIDLVLMLAAYTDVEALLKDIKALLAELQTYLVRYGEARLERVTSYSVQVELTGGGVTQSVDILPAVDLLEIGVIPKEIYDKMSRPGANIHEYSVTLGPLQVEIIKALPAKVKDLIRIIKYWEDVKMKSVKNRKWPSSYTLELVILHAWNQAGKPESFNMAHALHAVLTLLVEHQQLKATFPDQMKYSSRLLRIRSPPYIMDPTNPYNDMYHGLFDTAWDWEDVAMEARAWLRKPLLCQLRNTRNRWQ